MSSDSLETAGHPAPVARASDDAVRPGAAGWTTRRSRKSRRHSRDGRGAPEPDRASADRGAVPAGWYRLAILIGSAIVLSVLAGRSIPPLVSIVAAIAATALVLATPAIDERLSPVERAASRRRRLAMTGLLAAPLALTSLAFSHWMVRGGLDYHWGVASIISLTAAAAVLLGNRLVPIFAAKAACWAAYALVDQSPVAMGAAAVAILGLALVTRYQARIHRAETERREALDRRQHRAEEILRDYEDTGQGWFWETDRRGQIAYLSDSVARALGRDKNELEGRPFVDLFDLSTDNREGERTLVFHLAARSAFSELAVRANSPSEERWWSVNGRPVFDEFRNFCGFRGSGTDLTEKRRSAEHAARLAQFDPLTGLANRRQMSQSLEKILAAPLEMHRECGVLLLDLDRFKHVNDTLGHPAGDALLEQVAQRLVRSVGKAGQVGRLGGDEFQIIVAGRVDRAELAALAHEVIASLSQPYSISGNRVTIGASVGVAVSPDDGTTSESLIRNADLALYAAKDGGRGRFHFYSADLHLEAEQRSRLEHDLRDAIATNGLELYYQPVVDISTEKISGFEALLRWHHPVHGWMSPAKFVPIAEEAGLIGAIGDWALYTACSDLARWPSEVRCAVNVSPLQFANPDLPAIVSGAISNAGIAPSRLELEITESAFLNDDAETDAMFAALKAIGVRIALDDFGTGYSSLGYLKKAPFDKIKIDQSFVRGATEDGSRNGAIIASITSLAQALGMDTTAEGVETMDELDIVRMYGCSHVQGYIYERPLDAAGAIERLRTGLAAVAAGPRSARSARQSMLRKVVIEHGGHYYNGTIRNVSRTGALVEGLWNVPAGTIFRIALSDSISTTATARWSSEGHMGVEFAAPIERDASGSFSAIAHDAPISSRREFRRSA